MLVFRLRFGANPAVSTVHAQKFTDDGGYLTSRGGQGAGEGQFNEPFDVGIRLGGVSSPAPGRSKEAHVSPRLAFLLALACAGSLSCGSRATGFLAPKTAPTRDIRMELSVSSPGNRKPALITAVVRNVGDISVGQVNLCPVPVIRIYDGQNVELLQLDPTVPVACPLMLVAPLGSGMRVEFMPVFDGTYYSAAGQRLDAPPGTYRAVATFEYRTIPGPGGAEEPGTVTREQPLIWQ